MGSNIFYYDLYKVIHYLDIIIKSKGRKTIKFSDQSTIENISKQMSGLRE